MPLAILITMSDEIWRAAHFAVGIAGFLVAVGMIIRFGFRYDDANLIVPKAVKGAVPYIMPRMRPAE